MEVQLTDRQQRIVAAVANGKSVKEIGRAECCSPHTVRFELRMVGAKINGDGPPRTRILRWWFSRPRQGEIAC